MVCRTYNGPRRSVSHTPIRGTERHYPPQVPIDSDRLDQECERNARARAQRLAVGESFVWRDASALHLARIELATFSV